MRGACGHNPRVRARRQRPLQQLALPVVPVRIPRDHYERGPTEASRASRRRPPMAWKMLRAGGYIVEGGIAQVRRAVRRLDLVTMPPSSSTAIRTSAL
jgi:hypothetical protein